MKALYLYHAHIVTPFEVLEDYVLLTQEDKIVAVGKPNEVSCPTYAQKIDIEGNYLVPGFIDLQVNGGFGEDFSANPNAIWEVAQKLPRYGVTAFLPTIITSSMNTYLKAQQVLLQGKPTQWKGAFPVGLHFEGPFLNPKKKGAHHAAYIIPPSLEAVRDWTPANGVLLVTMAPEIEGALAVIKALAVSGIVVSAGHSNASYAQMMAGLQYGMIYGTHLFNAMPALQHREPGVVGAILASDTIFGGVIADGLHVHPAVVSLLWKLLGEERLIVVTDCMAALGKGEGRYQLADLEVIVDGQSARLSDGTLAGSILSLDVALRNMLTFTQDSLGACLKSITSTPAKMMAWKDRGCLSPACFADMNILSRSHTLMKTIIQGQVWDGE